MNGSAQFKVCGLTSLGDAEFAVASGAAYMGFILHPKSPRYVSFPQFIAMAPRLPDIPKVAVVVEPAAGKLSSMKDAGFEHFQVHFGHDLPLGVIEGWSREVGADNLWLAPKLPPAIDVDAAWLALADTVLLDTFDPVLFGGTGRTGDWPKFREHIEGPPGQDLDLIGRAQPGERSRCPSGHRRALGRREQRGRVGAG